MNRGIFAPQANEYLVEFPQGNSTTDGRVQTGVVVGRFNQINGYGHAYILGHNNIIETQFINGAAVKPAAFVVGDGHQLGAFNYNFTVPTGQVLISPGVPYKFAPAAYGNIIIDAGGFSGTTTVSQQQARSFGGQGCVVLTTGLSGTNGMPAGTSGATVINSTMSVASGSTSIGGGTGVGAQSVSIGSYSTATGSFSVAMGFGTSSAGTYSTSLGVSVSGTANRSFAVGSYVTTESPGEYAYGQGGFVNALDAKAMQIVTRVITSDATATELKTAGGTESYTLTPTGVIILSNNGIYQFDCEVLGATATDTAGWNLRFMFRRGANAAASSIVGTPILTPIAASAGASAWALGVTADTTNGRPNISVTGAAATTIRWVGNYRVTKVGL